VDIEEVKADFKGMQIASHFFSDEEIAELAKLQPELANEAFFECWTGKEAYVKARGDGLSLPLRGFTMRFVSGEQVLQDEGGRVWTCYALKPAPGQTRTIRFAIRSWKRRRWPP